MDKLYSEIKNADNIYIVGHISPDGDCIGACMSLGTALMSIGKKCSVLLEKKPEEYDFIYNDKLFIGNFKKADLFISLDCGDIDRLKPFYKQYNSANKTMNIDHHISNTKYSDINFVLVDVSSTCEILYSFINKYFTIDKYIAKCLYTGIVYDTGGFKHTNTSSDTMIIGANLLKYGIDTSYIMNRLFYTKSYNATKMMGVAMLNMTKIDNIGFSYVSLEDVNEYEAKSSDCSGIIQYIQQVEGVDVSVFMHEDSKNIYKVSLRSNGIVDVSSIAKLYGGGGHKKASGCIYRGDRDIFKRDIINIIKGDILKER